MSLQTEVEGLAMWLAKLMAEDPPAAPDTAAPYADDWDNAVEGLGRASEKFVACVELFDNKIIVADLDILKLDEESAKAFPWERKSVRQKRAVATGRREQLGVLRDLASDLLDETNALSARAGVLKRRAEPMPAGVKKAREDERSVRAKVRTAEVAEKAAKEQLAQAELVAARARAEQAGAEALKEFEARLNAELQEEMNRDKAAAEARENRKREKAADPAEQVRLGQQSVETARGWIEAPEGKELDASSLAFLEELDVLTEMALGLRQRIGRVH